MATDELETAEELTFIEVLDELEYYLANGRKLPLTSTVVVNEEDILDLLDRIRGALPVELTKAREVVEKRGDIIESAHAEAEHHLTKSREQATAVVEQAQDDAERLLDEHVLVEQARSRAQELIADAEQQAEAITGEAERYAVSVMEQLESHLAKTLTTVRNGLDSLPNAKNMKKRKKSS